VPPDDLHAAALTLPGAARRVAAGDDADLHHTDRAVDFRIPIRDLDNVRG
jgi:hypothetical protein